MSQGHSVTIIFWGYKNTPINRDNYIYNYKTETLIPKRTGNYYVGIELIDNKRKKLYIQVL